MTAFFLYFLLFVVLSPIMFLVAWLIVRYHRARDAKEEGRP